MEGRSDLPSADLPSRGRSRSSNVDDDKLILEWSPSGGGKITASGRRAIVIVCATVLLLVSLWVFV